MKTKNLFAVILLSLILVSCVPFSIPAATLTTSPTTTATSTAIPATPTSQPIAIVTQSNIPTSTPYVNEKASADCFLKIPFIPGKTGMKSVISVWGDAAEKESLGSDLDYWYFDFVGEPHAQFDKQKLETVVFFLKNCSLEKIIAKLGPPEKVEITTIVSCTSDYSWTTQNFHYPSLGFSYYRSCDKTQDCYIFHPADLVDGKEFYPSDKIIEDSTGFNMAGYVYNWHGFNVNVEEIENKIPDYQIINK